MRAAPLAVDRRSPLAPVRGSGLKHAAHLRKGQDGDVSPGSGQGSGLKQHHPRLPARSRRSLPWLRSGERIETLRPSRCRLRFGVSPGSGQGSGLKRVNDVEHGGGDASPLAPVRGAD